MPDTPTPPKESMPMSEETGNQSALRILQGQVESLTAQLMKLTTERDEYRDALSGVSDERDGLKAKIASPDAQSARIAELEAERRDRLHYDKFAELAKGAKAKDKAVKDLWKLSGYKAEHDKVDEDALAEVLERLKTEADYAFDSEQQPTETGAPAPKPVPAGGRGGRTKGQDGPHLTREQMADPRFMLDKRNAAYIAACCKAQESSASGPFISG